MKHIDNIINQFNTPDTHLVVSAWPQARRGKEMNHGVAWYTKLTLTEMAKKKHLRFVVLAEEGFDNTPELVEHGRILVLRVFSPTHQSLYPTILRWLQKFSNISHVYVHSEFGAGTGLTHYALLLPFLAIIRLAGKRITYFAHNVISDITFLQNHLGIDASPFAIDLTNILIHIHTYILGKIVDRIVVLDEALKQRLEKMVPNLPIIATSIPVKKAQTISRTKARQILHISTKEKVILVFGFLSAYKGSDWAVHAFGVYAKTSLGRKTRLIMAGGAAHSLKHRPHYQTFLSSIEKTANITTNIHISGFVPEKDITTYFAAADLVMLPYRGLMGASGSLTHALAYRKAFMLANPMGDIWKNKDMRDAAQEAGVDKTALFFPLSSVGMHEILKTIHTPSKLKRLTNMSQALSQTRAIQYHVEREHNDIYTAHTYVKNRAFSLLKTIGLASS